MISSYKTNFVERGRGREAEDRDKVRLAPIVDVRIAGFKTVISAIFFSGVVLDKYVCLKAVAFLSLNSLHFEPFYRVIQ